MRRTPILAALSLVLAVGLAQSAYASRTPSRSVDYATPGYKGLKKAPRTGPAPAPPSISLGSGTHPDVWVDEAGTSHVVWNEEGPADGSDVVHYCRIPRGAKACDNANGTPFPPINEAYSHDVTGGPKILQIGDGLVVLQHRYPALVTQPDGQQRSDTLYEWTSSDGGTTWTGPGISGVVEPSGDVAAIGDNIGVISDTVTGGTQLQILSSASFSPTPILIGPGDAAYGGTIAADQGGVPIVAFRDLNNVTYVRRFTGAGDVNDPGTWSTATFPGVKPKLASGTAGTFVMYRSSLLGPWALRSVAQGQPSATGTQLSPDDNVTDDAELLERADGKLRAMWTTSTPPQQVVARDSLPGGLFGGPDVIAQADGISALRASGTGDGGGVTVYERALGNARDIAATPFGTLSPTGKRGAGSLAGTGIPGAEAGCQLVKFGAVEVRPHQGCLRPSIDTAFRGAFVAHGEIDLNGLAIVPIANAQIVIDPRRGRISSIGDVKLVLRGGGLPELTLMRGKIDIDLKGNASVGEMLLKDLSPSGLDLGGFPISGDIDVQLTKGGLRIPLTLKLPPELGGVSGTITLVVKPLEGVTIESVHVHADQVPIGPLTLEDIDVTYANDKWDGAAALRLPPPRTGAKISLDVHFEHGRFLEAGVSIQLPGFGVLIAPQTYFYKADGRFRVDPIFLSLTGHVGAMPIKPDGPTFTVTVNGTISLTVAKDLEFGLQGTAEVAGLSMSEITGLLTTGGYAEVNGKFKLELLEVSVDAGGGIAIDGKSGKFAGQFEGDMSIADIPLLSGTGVVSNNGAGACVSELGSYGLVVISTSGDISVDGGVGKCGGRLDSYKGQVVRTRAGTRQVAHAAQAGTGAITVPPNTTGLSVEVTGAGGVPDVVLVDPAGRQIVPQAFGTAGATAIAFHVPSKSQEIIGLKAPAAGNWTVQPAAGSVPIAGVRTAQALPPVDVKGTLRGSGRSRTLRYTASNLTGGARVRVFEAGHGNALPVGVISRSRGTLKLRAGEGRAALRTITGYVETAGQPPTQAPITIARYRAPGVAAAPRVRGASVALRGGRATVRWRRAPDAAGYLVTVALRDGRVLTRSVGRSVTSVTVRGLGSRARLRRATVRSRAATSVLGPVARARSRRS
jgi:hypothetical protein